MLSILLQAGVAKLNQRSARTSESRLAADAERPERILLTLGRSRRRRLDHCVLLVQLLFVLVLVEEPTAHEASSSHDHAAGDG